MNIEEIKQLPVGTVAIVAIKSHGVKVTMRKVNVGKYVFHGDQVLVYPSGTSTSYKDSQTVMNLEEDIWDHNTIEVTLPNVWDENSKSSNIL